METNKNKNEYDEVMNIYLIKYASLRSREKKPEDWKKCGSLEEAVKEAEKIELKTTNTWLYDSHAKAVSHIPAKAKNGTWTPNNKQEREVLNLLMTGTNTGVTNTKNQVLIRLENVDFGGGDGFVDHGVFFSNIAYERVKNYKKSNTGFFWH